MSSSVFATERRIKLGIWGLGRGSSFLRSLASLNIDVVAGCDYHENMRQGFLKNCPDAFVTDNEDEFLASDIDAVLVATYCPDHGKHAVKALEAGKHVLSEVMAFMTPAEGVALVEAVERTGLVYNMTENYPFSLPNLYLAKLWKEGLFGELSYAEYEYVHGVGRCFTNPDGTPLEPGNRVHHWRGWLNYHYYCSHSLGPVMVITGLRPTQVVSLLPEVENYGVIKGEGYHKDGFLPGLGAFAPSLVKMSNGGVVRNLMGGTTADSHNQRLYGTKASAELHPLRVKVGATGSAMHINLKPEWESLGDLGTMAASTGHGGGDFWVIYYFARQILTGEPAPWDVYSSADVTLTGIQALRSATQGGVALEVPDFRDPAVRDRYRNDNWVQKHHDTYNIFPKDQDITITGNFSSVGAKLNPAVTRVRKVLDSMKVFKLATAEDKVAIINIVKELRDDLPQVVEIYREARKIVDAYPESQGRRALRELLEDVGAEERVMLGDKFVAELNEWLIAR